MESTVPSMFPKAASMKERPRPAPARPVAPRVVDASWDVTAATPVKATPTRAIEAPATRDPAAGCPASSMASPSSPASTTFAASATITAAAKEA